MKRYIENISVEEFQKEVVVRFDNILEGFDEFNNITLDFIELNYNEEKIIDLFYKLYDLNNGKVCIDLYLNKLSCYNRERILKLVSKEDKRVLEELMMLKYKSVYFKLLSKELIPFLIRLNTREIFFVSFYFFEKHITIWGNYKLKFPCFFDNQKTKEYYEEYIF